MLSATSLVVISGLLASFTDAKVLMQRQAAGREFPFELPEPGASHREVLADFVCVLSQANILLRELSDLLPVS